MSQNYYGQVTNNYNGSVTNNYVNDDNTVHFSQPNFKIVVELSLTNSDIKALVDEKYFQHLSTISHWCLQHATNGVISTCRLLHNRTILLHRYIMMLEGIDPGENDVDHVDKNRLNNCVDNLRLATTQWNCRNRTKRKGSSSQFLGVHWDNDRKRWRAQISHDYKKQHLGMYICEEEAARAYDQGLRSLNIPEEFKTYNFPL